MRRRSYMLKSACIRGMLTLASGVCRIDWFLYRSSTDSEFGTICSREHWQGLGDNLNCAAVVCKNWLMDTLLKKALYRFAPGF